MTTLYEQAMRQTIQALLAVGGGAPVHMPADEVAAQVLKRLHKACAGAYAAGVRPLYKDWLRMNDVERDVWEALALEAERARVALTAVAAGNPAMARRALHDGNEAALRQDAMELALMLDDIKEKEHA